VNGAFINLLNDAGGAFNVGFVTIARGATLVDLGGVNVSNNATAQIGFVNVTKRIKERMGCAKQAAYQTVRRC
jgi:hypothetical protein